MHVGTEARRGVQRTARSLMEGAVLAAAFASAYGYRFELPMPGDRVQQLLWLVVPVVLLEKLALRAFRAHRHSWQYASLSDLTDVILGLSAATVALLVLRFVPLTPWLAVIPVGVILANHVTAIVAAAGIRMLRRLQSERREVRRRDDGAAPRRVLLVGAGRAGVMVSKEIAQRPELGLRPVGFVDDDRAKGHHRIAGLDVLGTTDDLATLARTTGASEAILTMASVDRADIRRIVHACEAAGLDTQIIPGLFEIVGGQVNVSRIRPVSVEDLLGRDPVELDPTTLHELLGTRTVMVTGAGGSIGSELARQAARFGPSRIVLVERSEPALWAVHRSLQAQHPGLQVEACIADVTDEPRMRALFEQYRPQVVAHAAAHKHVPMMEDHPGEAVKNNVGGTRLVVDLAAEFAVDRFVLVSTDKAVNPTSVMGASKRITERYVQHVAARTGRNFVAVRFGNVLGSTGSVVPVFEQQVREGGPVTVTHPDMVRYFMTIPEASGLVLQAAALGSPGEILVLDMGRPVRIVDLAENVIRLSGFEPGRDIEVRFTGLRPGEKLFEELNLSAEHATRTRHPKVWIGRSDTPNWRSATVDVDHLLRVADLAPAPTLRGLIRQLVPEFTPEADVTIDLDQDARQVIDLTSLEDVTR